MSMQHRIEELTKRHAKIDEKIHEEQKRPASNDIVLQDLKVPNRPARPHSTKSSCEAQGTISSCEIAGY